MDTCTSTHVKSMFKSGTCPISRRPPSLPVAKEGGRVIRAAGDGGDLQQPRQTTMCESSGSRVVVQRVQWSCS